MLSTPAPFPQPGSYALYELAGRTHLVRIQYRDPQGDEVTLSFPLVPDIASGNRRARLADLIDGTPLSASDLSRLHLLEAEIARLAPNGRARRARRAEIDALRERDIRSRTLAEMLARVPDRTRRGSIRWAA